MWQFLLVCIFTIFYACRSDCERMVVIRFKIAKCSVYGCLAKESNLKLLIRNYLAAVSIFSYNIVFSWFSI